MGENDLLEALFEAMRPPRDYGVGRVVRQPTKVYRVEMPNGNGPFNSGLPNAHEIYQRINHENPPSYDCESLEGECGGQMGKSEQHFRRAHGHSDYGCESIEALSHWFPRGARGYLKGLGAKLVEYEVEPGGAIAHCGQGEVVFDRHSATRLAEHDLVQDVPEPKLEWGA